jgi:hypothetical protein
MKADGTGRARLVKSQKPTSSTTFDGRPRFLIQYSPNGFTTTILSVRIAQVRRSEGEKMGRMRKCLVAVLGTILLLASLGNLAGCDRHGGSTWTAMDSGTTARLNGIWGSSSSDVFAVGMDLDSWNGVILHYDGSTWSAMTSSSSSVV